MDPDGIKFKAFKPLGLFTVLFSVIWLSAFAMDLPYYNLDSLVWMAGDIVEGTVTRTSATTVDVSLTAVHGGDLHTGATITVAATDFYRVVDIANPRDLNGRGLQNGDRLILFLVDAKEGLDLKPLRARRARSQERPLHRSLDSLSRPGLFSVAASRLRLFRTEFRDRN